ncbi:MAG: hypothetical protein H7833_16005 [Magnetococcus sp. DMHC-1]|nr:hypothetical protein [Magnetococcales bacterium]
MITAALYPCPFDVQEQHDMNATILAPTGFYSYEEGKLTGVKSEGTVKFPERSLMLGCKQLGIAPHQVDLWVFPTPSRQLTTEDWLHFFGWILKAYDGTEADFPVWLQEHVRFVAHQSGHAASAVMASGFDSCAFLCMDGGGDAGDRRHTLFGEYRDGTFHTLADHAGLVGLAVFHAFLSDALGFVENGKTSGLAAYGRFIPELAMRFQALLTHQDSDVVFHRQRYGRTAINFAKLDPSAYFRDRFMHHYPSDTNVFRCSAEFLPQDIAKTGEQVMQEAFLACLARLRQHTRQQRIVLSGGLFQNVALNNQIVQSGLFQEYFFPMAASDAGLSLGQAFYHHKFTPGTRPVNRFLTPFLGPSYTGEEIRSLLEASRMIYSEPADLSRRCAELIAEGGIVGWFQGRAELGPRSLGARSILADPRNLQSKERINQYFKKRDWFMPYAPSILEEHVAEWVAHPCLSPYMQIAFSMQHDRQDAIPAAIHKDLTSRVHTVGRDDNPRYWELIRHFQDITGLPVVLNTSFNRHGISTIGTPRQAIEHLLDGCMDYLAIDNFLVSLAENRHISRSYPPGIPEDRLLCEAAIQRLETVLNHADLQAAKDYVRRLGIFLHLDLLLEEKEHLHIQGVSYPMQDGLAKLKDHQKTGCFSKTSA